MLHRMRNVLNKSCRENQNTHFTFNNFFFFWKSCHLWHNVEKCGSWGAIDDVTMWRVRVACWISKATFKHSSHRYITRTLPILFYTVCAGVCVKSQFETIYAAAVFNWRLKLRVALLYMLVVVVGRGRAAAAAAVDGGSSLTEPGSYTACFLHLVMKWINWGWNGTLSMRCVCVCARACTLQTSFCNRDKEWDRSRGVVVNGMIILKVMLEKFRLWEFSGCLRWRCWLISECFNKQHGAPCEPNDCLRRQCQSIATARDARHWPAEY
jgi:hypothetical protein